MNEINAAEMTPPASETVTAIYELPVPIWVSCAALGGTYPSGYGRVQFDVAMPQDLAPAGGPPVIDGVEVPESLDGELAAWTTEYAADVPDEFHPATAFAPNSHYRCQGPDRFSQIMAGVPTSSSEGASNSGSIRCAPGSRFSRDRISTPAIGSTTRKRSGRG